MRSIRYLFVAILVATAALSGCRKEDMTPYYNYVGGASEDEGQSTVETPAPMPSTDQPNISSIAGTRDLTYTELQIAECNPLAIPEGSGFIDNQTAFEEAWNEWCPGKTAPSVDFATNLVAYYFKNAGGCEDISLTGARAENSNLIVDITTTRKTQPCYCPMMLKMRRFLIAVERTGGTPSFNPIVVEVPCE